MSPAMQPSATPSPGTGHPVQNIVQPEGLYSEGDVKFVYQEMSGVDAALPAQLPSAGGARWAIHLPLAHPMETPKCMFGDAESLTCCLLITSRASARRQAGFHSVYVAGTDKTLSACSCRLRVQCCVCR